MCKRTHQLTLGGQLTVIASAIILIPLVLISTFLHRSSVDAYAQISARAGEMSMREARNRVEASLSHVTTVADKVVSDSLVQAVMKKAQGSDYPAAERIDDIRLLRSLLTIYEGDGAVNGIRLVFTHPQQWLSSNSFISLPMTDLRALLAGNGIDLEGEGMPREPVWVSHGRLMAGSGLFYQEGISYVRIIRDMGNFDRVLGYVVVYQQYTPYENLLTKADITGESVLAITGERGALIAIGGGEAMREAVWQAYAHDSAASAMQMLAVPLSPSGWTLTMLLPQTTYRQSVSLLTLQTIALALILCMVGMLFARRMYRGTLRRIGAIVACIEQVEQGDLGIRLAVVRQDELGSIESHLNDMLDRLDDLMVQTAEMERHDRLMRIRLLRSQINPHFLYNTLNSILWVAMDYGAAKVSQMIKALSAFYKIALQPGSDEATIGHELLHVQRYVALQNLRGEIDVMLRMEVDDTLREEMVPNMLLQPLVENCFVHGFVGRDRGAIDLSVRAEAEGIHIAVTDDGVGIPPDRRGEILASAKPEHAYGLFSIAERLRLRYGDAASISIAGGVAKGCRVEVRLPLSFGP